MASFGLQPFSSLTGQERTNIPSYDDMDEFTPAFNVPAAPAKRFETPRNFQQQPYQYQNYAYNYNNQYQDQSKNWLHEKLRVIIINSRIFKLLFNTSLLADAYGAVDQRATIAQAPQYPAQPQAFPNYYPQNQPEQQTYRRSDIPSYPQVFY